MASPKTSGTQYATGIRHQPVLISRPSGTSTLPDGESVEISHRGHPIAAHLQSTPLPNVRHVLPVEHGQHPFEFPPAFPPTVERDGYRVLQTPFPPFMDKWLKHGSEGLDSYPLPEIDSPPSSKRLEVGPPPGKRPCPFAGDAPPGVLKALHCSSVPVVLSELPEGGGDCVDELAATRALSSEDPVDLDPVALVVAVKTLVLRAHQLTILALAERDSYGEMVKFVKTLKHRSGAVLLFQARKWRDARNPLERNTQASQLMALLFLFSSDTPGLDELADLMNLLPLTWPPALEHLRKACLDGRAALVAQGSSAPRRELLARLYERYGPARGIQPLRGNKV